jgi:hypothetical protein
MMAGAYLRLVQLIDAAKKTPVKPCIFLFHFQAMLTQT